MTFNFDSSWNNIPDYQGLQIEEACCTVDFCKAFGVQILVFTVLGFLV